MEACETAVKLVMKWGYNVKGIPDGEAKVVFARGNFWGRSIGAVSSSTDPSAYTLGPFVPGFELVPYNDLDSLRELLEGEPNVAAVMLEPTRERRELVPMRSTFPESATLRQAQCPMIADEVQTGLCRTGRMLCVEHLTYVRPRRVGKGALRWSVSISAVLQMTRSCFRSALANMDQHMVVTHRRLRGHCGTASVGGKLAEMQRQGKILRAELERHSVEQGDGEPPRAARPRKRVAERDDIKEHSMP